MAEQTMEEAVELLGAGFATSWKKGSREMELRGPDEQASLKQLFALNARGALAIVKSGQVEPIRKGDASAALDALMRA